MRKLRLLKRNAFSVRKNHGFTLVELMITVAILAVLAVVAIPMYKNYVNRAKQSDAIIGLKAAQMAEEQFYSENNYYSCTIDILPGFADSNANDIFVKGAYTLTVVFPTPGASTVTTFTIEAKATIDGNVDRWTISNGDIDPVADTGSPGIQGFSLFRWLFD